MIVVLDKLKYDLMNSKCKCLDAALTALQTLVEEKLMPMTIGKEGGAFYDINNVYGTALVFLNYSDRLIYNVLEPDEKTGFKHYEFSDINGAVNALKKICGVDSNEGAD